eukprot:TRINITY_DN2508_c0_g1_i2.p1 TRINITY_DN2508_c0_g1~~TRINITY_DN2508_c0_g1_i2.p1  ORF type:complete len:253 (+),score=58.05 TRINITY_DN2508_c0_g1_i2:369-1127(+)
MFDRERIFTVEHYMQRGKTVLTSSHRQRTLIPISRMEEESLTLKLRELNEEDYKCELAPALAFFLTQLVRRNDKVFLSESNANDNCPSFNAQVPPDISIEHYFQRIIRYTPCSPECFLIAVIYIDQVIQKHKVVLNTLNIHRFLITSILIAAKLYDDATYNNKYYSHVGGVPLKELNFLEMKFLALLDFDMNVDADLFDRYRIQAEIQIIRWRDQNDLIAGEIEAAQDLQKQVNCSVEAREIPVIISPALRR